VGVPTAVKTTQLLYESTSQTGKPTINVTSVIQPSRAADCSSIPPGDSLDPIPLP
jgi:hypothetical protein